MEVTSEEYATLFTEFKADFQNHNNDYNKNRIEKGLKPITFLLRSAQRIINPQLESEFQKYKSEMNLSSSESREFR